MPRTRRSTSEKADAGLPLARPWAPHRAPIGFTRRAEPESLRPELLRSTAGHLLTIAPTGAGKGVSVIIPALLACDNPAIVIDPKGENFHVTARRRRQMGHRVVLLDPFGLTGQPSDALNPLDLARLGGDAPDDAGRMLADLIMGGTTYSADPFWDNTSGAFLSGLVTTALVDRGPEERRLSWIRSLFGRSDLVYEIACMLDTKRVSVRDAQEELAIFLQHPERETRPAVQSTAAQHLRLFGSDAVRSATDTTSFPLEELLEGRPLTIYVVLPVDKLVSHRALLRLWLGTILRALATRRRLPPRPTIMLVDEAAQLGRMEPLLQASTLMRGFGLRLWTFWQDASQLRSLYPQDWPSILNNASVLQVFGARSWTMARDFAELTGIADPGLFLELGAEEQVLMLEGRPAERARRVDYRRDLEFAGLWDPNPFHVGAAARDRGAARR
jgi:type IV secretion system protein VirD4